MWDIFKFTGGISLAVSAVFIGAYVPTALLGYFNELWTVIGAIIGFGIGLTTLLLILEDF